MYYVYLIRSRQDSRLYVDFSSNLTKRVKAHNQGKVRSTKAYRPWKLVYYEAYLAKSDARKREINLKKNNAAKVSLRNRIKESMRLAW